MSEDDPPSSGNFGSELPGELVLPKPYNTPEERMKFRIDNWRVGEYQVVGSAGLQPRSLKVTRYPDNDGGQIVIPRSLWRGDDKEYFLLHSHDQSKVSEQELDRDKAENIRYCYEGLGLPLLFAVYLAMEHSDKIDEFTVPEKGKHTSLVGIWGEGSSGKTTLATIMNMKLGLPVISFETDPNQSFDHYRAQLAEVEVNQDSSEEQIIEGIRTIREAGQKDNIQRSLRYFLDTYLEFFKTGERPEFMICDLRGVPRSPETRLADIFDVVAAQSMEIVFTFDEHPSAATIREKLTEDFEEVKADWRFKVEFDREKITGLLKESSS